MKSVTWALRLVFAVVIFELVIVAGTVVKCFDTDMCDENDPRTPTGSRLIKGPDGQMYDENFIKTIPGGFNNMQEIERRRNIFKGMP